MYVLALAKMSVHAHLYCQLRSGSDFHNDIFVHKNECEDSRSDDHTVDKIKFGVDVEDTYEKVGVDIGLENARTGIATSLSVIVVEKLDVIADWIHFGEC